MTVGVFDRLIGENVARLMRAQRISAREFAVALGTSESGISRRLRGERGWRAQNVADAARVLGVTIVDIYGADANDELPTHGSPFCAAHPVGTDAPCRDCGRARLALAIRDHDQRGVAGELDVSDAPVVEVDAEDGHAEVVRSGTLRLDVFGPEGIRLLRVEVESGSVQVQFDGHAREPIGGAS